MQGEHSTADQTVQTNLVVEGTWMSLKEASDHTGLSEKTLRRYAKRKVLKTRRVGKTANAKIQILVNDSLRNFENEDDAVSAEEVTFEEDELATEAESLDFTPEENAQALPNKAQLQDLVQELLGPLLSRVEQQAVQLSEKDKIIVEQSRQLRLIPDFQKQAREREQDAKLKEFEAEALKKQLAALEESKIAAESLATEAQKRVVDLESTTSTVHKEIEELRAQITQLRKPWWKKWLLPREIGDDQTD